MIVYYYRVEIYKKPIRSRLDEDKFETGERSVIAKNDTYMVLNDHWFTVIAKEKSYTRSQLGKPEITIRPHNNLLSAGVFYTLYSLKKVRPSTIKKQIERKLVAEYGWLINDIDLGVIQ